MEWWYDVSPKKPGNHALRLEVSFSSKHEEDETEHFHLVHQQAIPVFISTADWTSAFRNWKQLVQALVSSVAAGISGLAGAAGASRAIDLRPRPLNKHKEY
jgi:hypothetical protein